MRKALWIPQTGLIEGGRLDGWRYHFLGFFVRARRDAGELVAHWLALRARVTPPAWPFPHDLDLEAAHYVSLVAVPGERAKRLNADRLIASAYTIEGITPPAALLGWSKRMREEFAAWDARRGTL